MAKLKSGFFATWLKSCLAKKNLAFCHMALNQKSIYQESPIGIEKIKRLKEGLFASVF